MSDETQYASAEDLVSDEYRDQAEDVTLPNGRTIRVRGLTRHELFFNGKGAEDNNSLIEARNIASCVVQPKMTITQAEAWVRACSVRTMQVVQDKIRELSGLSEGADKRNLAEAGDGS